MSLGLYYSRPRLVALGPNVSALEAARALENNNIGAVVVVQAKGQVVGIVTDRDLAVRVVGRGLDPKEVRLADVMTTPVATLSSTHTQADAIRLMHRKNIRRIPLVDDGRLVGIVTLDDLLVDEAAPLDDLAEVVEAQIGEGGPATRVRSAAAARSAGRAASTYGRFLGQVRAATGLDGPEKAEAALEIVLASVVRRLTSDEADDLIAQLPSVIQPSLSSLPKGPDKSITREAIVSALAQRFDIDTDRAEQVLKGVGVAVARLVSRGEMEEVRNQLPRSMRDIFGPEAPEITPPSSREPATTRS